VVNALSCVVHKSTGGFLPCFLNTIRNVQKRKLPSLNFNPGCIKVVDTFRAAVDRLVHHSTIFEMNVESYRRRVAAARAPRKPRGISDSKSDNEKP
jgi:hypothetical protein